MLPVICCRAFCTSRCLIQKHVVMQGADLKQMMELIESAQQFGMRNVMACCEHFIANDSTGKFNNALKRIPAGGSARAAACINRMCVLRDHPVQTWDVEHFYFNNVNGSK